MLHELCVGGRGTPEKVVCWWVEKKEAIKLTIIKEQ